MGCRMHCCTLGLLVVCLLMLWGLASCREEQEAPVKDAASSALEVSEPEAGKDPQITVGNVSLSLPAPEGFERIEPEVLPDLRLSDAESADEVLLCVFVRKNSISREGSNAEGQAVQNDTETAADAFANLDKSGISAAEFDILRINTLEKWLNSSFSAESFVEMKAQWQNNSIVCTEQTVGNFVESAKTALADLPGYTYNLGMTGYGRERISFARIIKEDANAGGEAVFFCSVKSLLYRDGKILGLEYTRRIEDFAEIIPAIEGHMLYLNALHSQAGAMASQQMRLRTAGRFIVSSVHSFSRAEDVFELYGSYRRVRY
ncbi:MAG: hypothetical protein LBM00_09190 [Deltaproteobacteria bacterium]|nr:hypothetical protein [Deltaproteobacteria bacterium]